VALDNLIDLIINCIGHPAAVNQIFLVSDGEDLSTSELMNYITSAMGKRSRLIPINEKILELCLKIIGKNDMAQRLCGSLQVDISKAEKLLNWTPPIGTNEVIKKTTQHFLESIN
jgi:UDP-glucose 4-epimerase